MPKDFRGTSEFETASAFYEALFGMSGHVFGARALCGHTRSSPLWFIGQSFGESFDGGVSNHLCQVPRDGGKVEKVDGRETRQIRLSPNGSLLAVACASPDAGSDCVEVRSDDEVLASQPIPGRVEQIEWSPDGKQLLLVVAGQGADLAGIHGGYAQKQASDAPGWLPEVSSGGGDELWRSLWLWDGRKRPRQLTRPPLNIWEASWCGNDAIAAITSGDHAEGSWYASHVTLIDASSGRSRELHRPLDQVGYVRGSSDGGTVAFIEAFCSDRGLVAGRLMLLDVETGKTEAPDTSGVDITSIEWRSAGRLCLAGLRGHETVVLDYDCVGGSSAESWCSKEFTSGDWAPAATPIGDAGALLVAESYAQAPFLAEVEHGALRTIASLEAPGAATAMSFYGTMEPCTWTAPDGWEIQGWLARPAKADGPAPILIDVHGGPISAHRNRWMARLRAASLMVGRGWTVLFPNPRGSTGRGDAFARAVKGDMGGADALDITSGIDALVARGLADPKRVAVTGTSYGGFMSAWLPTRDQRFAAAIPISPVGDWYSQHRTSQIPEFDALMLETSPWDEGGAYFARSPAFFHQQSPVPTLIMAGGLDKSTPRGQAEECHFAALRSGAPSALVIYPNAGHSVRVYPEYIDTAARILWWLDRYIGSPEPATKE
ncbi:MAG: S9 family peptidase [Rhizobiaceae bacterium]|nr:S9 family peptidase [Rhizobiaceae bacterium]